MDVLMRPDPASGELRPCYPGEEKMATETWPIDQVRKTFANGGGASAGKGSCCQAQDQHLGYRDRGSRGPAPDVRGTGMGLTGLHLNTTSDTTATSRALAPGRPVRITQLIAHGTDLHNWRLNVLRVNQDVLKHGASAPMSIFSPRARLPIAFDLLLSTADLVTTEAQTHVSVTGGRLFIAGANCWDLCGGLSYPCSEEPIRATTAMGGPGNNRQIILGMGVVAPTENAGTATLSDTPDSPIRLGRLVLDAVFNGTTPDVVPYAGLTAGNGVYGLSFIEVTQVDRQSVDLLTNVPTNGAIPGEAFHPEAGGVFFANIEVANSDTLNVAVTNRTAEGSGTIANTITVCGAFVGNELIC